MTTQMSIRDIERLLRAASPDEPANLPPLVLPTDVRAVRGAVRLRPRLASPNGVRTAYALVALLLAAAIVAAGALRLLDRPDPLELSRACDPMIAGLDDCLPVTVPDGWVNLGEGQFQGGEFAEEGLGYAFVQQIMATQAFACPTPGGPFPEAVPSGDGSVVEVPVPTLDAGLACLRTAPLPDGAIRIVTISGTRILDGDEVSGGIQDLSEPTLEAGWTETVDGRPARLTIRTGSAGQPAETRIWDVIRPGSIGSVLRIHADIAGPDLEAGRREVQAVVDAVDFKWDVPPLEAEDANAVLKSVVDQMDRGFREGSLSDLYSCFPRMPGSREATVRGSDMGPLAGPLDVTCSSRIEPSVAGVWRITLEVSWEAGDGHAGDTLRIQYFSTGQPHGLGGIDISGGETTSLSGRTASWDDPTFSWFPNGGRELPERLAGPLNIPPGSLATILWPGEWTADEPGGGDDSSNPSIVGARVYVLDGPVHVDGEEWYRVQAGTSFPVDPGWMRGTRDGRPQLRVIEPDCPDRDGLTIGDITWLIHAERLLCFGSDEITIEAATTAFEPQWEMIECVGEDLVTRPCPTAAGEWGWIAAQSTWRLFGADGITGPEPGMEVWLAPGVALPEDAQAVRVRGHWDDPAAQSCSELDAAWSWIDDDALRVLLCRERFVITSIEPR